MWKNMLTFTKKGNDSIAMEQTKMEKYSYYYGTDENGKMPLLLWNQGSIILLGDVI